MGRRLAFAVVAVAMALPAFTTVAHASPSDNPPNVTCHSGDFLSGIYHNVRVAKDNFCEIAGATVTGNVIADGATQVNLDGATVYGNVLANGDTNPGFICGSTIGGNLVIHQTAAGAGPPPMWEIGEPGSCNFLPFDVTTGNYIGGNLEFSQNHSGAMIFGNDVEGNLGCEGNTPPPTGAGNAVDGQAMGQCAGFDGGVDDSTSPPDSD